MSKKQPFGLLKLPTFSLLGFLPSTLSDPSIPVPGEPLHAEVNLDLQACAFMNIKLEAEL